MSGDVDQALFEGPFKRALEVDATLASALLAHGYDTSRPVHHRYPGHVFAACVEAARAHLHAEVPPDEGLRQLGLTFVGGFRETILGRVVTTALPILGPARFLPKLPGRFRSVRSDATVVVEVTSPHTATLVFTDPLPLGPFFAGVVEAALRLAKGEQPTVALTPTPSGYRLEASW